MKHITPAVILEDFQDKYEWDRKTIINEELQFYVEKNPDTFSLQSDPAEGTVLGIKARKENVIVDGVAQPYSSGVLISHGTKHQVKVGDYVEARLKLPAGEGLWPAFWLLREDAVWAKDEIDILEGIGELEEGHYHTAMHSIKAEGGTWQVHGDGVKTGIDLTTSYNNYGAFIGDGFVEFYFNEVFQKRVDMPAEMRKVKSWYMLLNLAVAGEGTWAANGAKPPYNWETQTMYCAGITITQRNDSADGVVDTKPDSTQDEEQYPDKPEGVTDEMLDALVDMRNRYVVNSYNSSTTLAKVLYDLARRLGGRL